MMFADRECWLLPSLIELWEDVELVFIPSEVILFFFLPFPLSFPSCFFRCFEDGEVGPLPFVVPC